MIVQPVRPPLLNPLFAPVTRLNGLGPRLAKLVEKVAGPFVVDLLFHLPTGLVDRRFAPKIAEAPEGRVATITVRVDGHAPPVLPNRPYKVRCTDETGFLELVYFHARGDWLEKLLPIGKTMVVSGRVEWFNNTPQIAHPDAVVPVDAKADIETVETVYPLTAGLQPKVLRRAIGAAVQLIPDLLEWQDPAWLSRQGWPSWSDALRLVHAPESEDDLSPETPARRRLAYDELLASQLALMLVRAAQRRRRGRSLAGDGQLRKRVLENLPFALTSAQDQALQEIIVDLGADLRMLRLLQGDVGSGKTVVATLAMLAAVEAGAQAALMAPTEILARQHFESIGTMVGPAGVSIDLLVGRGGGRGASAARAATLDRLAAGETDLVIGTHALFQDEVTFRDLGLAVIDEQHRFGVHQRLLLSGKGRATDVLVMTATPIPRTLSLTAYGDMEQSRLVGKPPGRKPVDTRTVPLDRLDEVVDALARRMAQGAQAYWVCPLVEESESVDLADATARFAGLSERFGDRVGLLHGRMKSADKDAVMGAFLAGRVRLLVATTVIEVGVNVPTATLMVIEHAERFGLAQLHQLRGRIGRGDQASSCLLLYDPRLTEAGRARLKIIRETEDGFLIAEEDLRLRGPGEVLGTRQSGLPAFHLADLSMHGDLLAAAADDARLLTTRDPDLRSPRGEAARILLYLLKRDEAVRYLRSG